MIGIQVITHNFQSSSCLEYKLKILNDSTFWKIGCTDLENNEYFENDSTKTHYIKALRFKPITTKLNSTCWLKEKKWFWCNEDDWRKYMESKK